MQHHDDTQFRPIIEALRKMKETENISVDAMFRKQLEEKLLHQAHSINQKQEDRIQQPWWRLWVVLVPTALVLVIITQQFLTLPVAAPLKETLAENSFNAPKPVMLERESNEQLPGIEAPEKVADANKFEAKQENPIQEEPASINNESINKNNPAITEPASIKAPQTLDDNKISVQPKTPTPENPVLLSPETIAKDILNLPVNAPLNSIGKEIASTTNKTVSQGTSVNAPATTTKSFEHTIDKNDTFVDTSATTNNSTYQISYPSNWATAKQQQFKATIIDPLIKQKTDAAWGNLDEIDTITVKENVSNEVSLQILYKNALAENFQYHYKPETNSWYK